MWVLACCTCWSWNVTLLLGFPKLLYNFTRNEPNLKMIGKLSKMLKTQDISKYWERTHVRHYLYASIWESLFFTNCRSYSKRWNINFNTFMLCPWFGYQRGGGVLSIFILLHYSHLRRLLSIWHLFSIVLDSTPDNTEHEI